MTIQEVTSWCNGQIGQPADGSQHLSFINRYYQHLTGRNPRADGILLTSAKDIWTANPAGFTKYHNNADDTVQLPPPCSIIFWQHGAAVVDHADEVNIAIWVELSGSGVQHATYKWPGLYALGWWVWDGLDVPQTGSNSSTAEPDMDAKPLKSGSTYTWVQGDSIWRVAPRFGLRVAELLEHNGIDDVHTIRPGTVLHLPIPHLIVSDYAVNIELLKEPRHMHICVARGARKVSFGYAKSFNGMMTAGPSLSFNSRQLIMAVAHVRIGSETRDFYMDAAAIGDYAITKRVRYMIGFRQEDLEDGYVSRIVVGNNGYI